MPFRGRSVLHQVTHRPVMLKRASGLLSLAGCLLLALATCADHPAPPESSSQTPPQGSGRPSPVGPAQHEPAPVGPAPPVAAQASTLEQPTGLEAYVLRGTNQQRARHGLPAVAWEPGLAGVARLTSDDLVQRRRLQHKDAQGRGPSERVALGHRRLIGLVGENLAAFSGSWPQQDGALADNLLQGWMDSPGHRANILRRDYTHLGVGCSSRGRELRCTQLFAAAKVFLATDLPARLEQGSRHQLRFVHGPAPEGVSLRPVDQARSRERLVNPQFQPPDDWRIDREPGRYRLRFFFRQSARRLSVIDGPIVDIESPRS